MCAELTHCRNAPKRTRTSINKQKQNKAKAKRNKRSNNEREERSVQNAHLKAMVSVLGGRVG